MLNIADDLRIGGLRPLIPPAILLEELAPSVGFDPIARKRREIEALLRRDSSRLLVVVGPCSLHDEHAAREYARWLCGMAGRYEEDLLVVMRCYFEKPRTVVGWKGLINDPGLDGSYQINRGLRIARRLLCDIVDLDLGVACEFLDPISPQFIADLVSWGAIGARTSESQVHRELASGLSMPVGFKNGTNGGVKIAIDGVRAALRPHRFLSVTKQGLAAIVETRGNPHAHIILRGGSDGPNYAAQKVQMAAQAMEQQDLLAQIMVDCSHANSGKDHRKQPAVCDAVAEQVAQGQQAIRGVMIESFLREGRQDLGASSELVYGQSITDACVDLPTTESMLEALARASRARRANRPPGRAGSQAAAART